MHGLRIVVVLLLALRRARDNLNTTVCCLHSITTLDHTTEDGRGESVVLSLLLKIIYLLLHCFELGDLLKDLFLLAYLGFLFVYNFLARSSAFTSYLKEIGSTTIGFYRLAK